MKWVSVALYLVTSGISTSVAAVAQNASHLADNTVLIVRHAEKPETGADLNETGRERARRYAKFFEPFQQDGYNVRVDALYAGADSQNSSRPRQTLEPLGKATGMALDLSVGTKDPDKLVQLLATAPHPSHPLVAWRHGQIPALLKAFGASPDALLTGGVWPDNVFDWVIVLQFDAEGKLKSSVRLQEHLAL